jgi:acetyl-CoA C-acetyltransferase
MSSPTVIVAAARTAVGKFTGTIARIPASDLGAHVIRGLLARTGLAPTRVDEVIMGQVLTGGCGQNPARQAAIAAGLPHRTAAMTINKVCGSGLKAIVLGAQAIACGDAEVVIAGGQENMSLAPHVLPGSREGHRLGDARLVDSMVLDGLWDAFNQLHMGITAETVASRYGISRQEQDEFGARSQQKAEAAQRAGRFTEEILPLEVPQKQGSTTFAADEYVRPGTTLAALSALKPAFTRDGTVTAGNASGVNDGAAAVVLMSMRTAEELRLPPLARIKAYASAGVDPAVMGLGPIPASRACLARAGWDHDQLDLIELNEAFAAQAIAVNREMSWDTSRVNVNGGAIAIGHPIGASGARITVTLVHEMVRRQARRGLASLCIGGGMGIALAIER